MKTNEEKLKQLLQIAVENGWIPQHKLQEYIIEEYQSFQIFENVVGNHQRYEDYKEFSLNDLISNWERSEISFVEALLNAWFHKQLDETKSVAFEKPIILMDDDGIKREIYYITHLTPSYIRFYWNEKPTSQRLNWLFEIFNYLL
jgi:hypothetical protein